VAAGRGSSGEVPDVGVLIARQLGLPGGHGRRRSSGSVLPAHAARIERGCGAGEARACALPPERWRRGSGSRCAWPRVPEGACGALAGRMCACPSERRRLGVAGSA